VFQAPPDASSRARRRRSILTIAVTIAIFVGLLATRGHAWGTRRPPSSAAAATTPAEVVDRRGVPIEPGTLAAVEAACRQRELDGGEPFCRCVRRHLPANVAGPEIVDATTALLAGKRPPARVLVVMGGCAANPDG
jgi:hypothetical protein